MQSEILVDEKDGKVLTKKIALKFNFDKEKLIS